MQLSELMSNSNHLRMMALKFTKDDFDADDLIQDTLMKAVLYRANFKPGTNLKAWLSTIMKNTFINSYRKKKSQQKYKDMAQSAVIADVNLADFTFLSEDIDKAKSVLNTEERIMLNYVSNGFKYAEIAKHLDLPIGTVKSKIFYIRKKLLKELQNLEIL